MALLRSRATELCAGLGPLLEPFGRIHVLTEGVLASVGPVYLDSAEEEAVARELEAAAGRPVAIGRGEPLEDEFQLLALDREVLNVMHCYFEHASLKHWQFSRNRSRTGINPHAVEVAGLKDAADVKQQLVTYLQEIPFLYSGARVGASARRCLARADAASTRRAQ